MNTIHFFLCIFLYTIKTGVTYCKGGDSTPDLALNDVIVGNGSLYNSDLMFCLVQFLPCLHEFLLVSLTTHQLSFGSAVSVQFTLLTCVYKPPVLFCLVYGKWLCLLNLLQSPKFLYCEFNKVCFCLILLRCALCTQPMRYNQHIL